MILMSKENNCKSYGGEKKKVLNTQDELTLSKPGRPNTVNYGRRTSC